MAWLTNEQLSKMGFASFGRNVMLSDKASYYNCKNIRLGDNIRIDDFCVLSAGLGGIDIGNHVHIAVFASLIGSGNINAADFCGIAARVSIFSSNDDYSGRVLTGPTVPEECRNVTHADVRIGRHVIIGAGSVILPGVTLEDGVAVGALSLIKEDCKTFEIHVGIPAKRVGERKRDLIELEGRIVSSKIDE